MKVLNIQPAYAHNYIANSYMSTPKMPSFKGKGELEYGDIPSSAEEIMKKRSSMSQEEWDEFNLKTTSFGETTAWYAKDEKALKLIQQTVSPETWEKINLLPNTYDKDLLAHKVLKGKLKLIQQTVSPETWDKINLSKNRSGNLPANDKHGEDLKLIQQTVSPKTWTEINTTPMGSVMGTLAHFSDDKRFKFIQETVDFKTWENINLTRNKDGELPAHHKSGSSFAMIRQTMPHRWEEINLTKDVNGKYPAHYFKRTAEDLGLIKSHISSQAWREISGATDNYGGTILNNKKGYEIETVRNLTDPETWNKINSKFNKEGKLPADYMNKDELQYLKSTLDDNIWSTLVLAKNKNGQNILHRKNGWEQGFILYSTNYDTVKKACLTPDDKGYLPAHKVIDPIMDFSGSNKKEHECDEIRNRMDDCSRRVLDYVEQNCNGVAPRSERAVKKMIDELNLDQYTSSIVLENFVRQ